LVEVFGSFDLVHAHDWLVDAAAGEISDRLRLPLVATIHATEHGRNRGLHNDLQRHIHNLETELARRATMIIGRTRGGGAGGFRRLELLVSLVLFFEHSLKLINLR